MTDADLIYAATARCSCGAGLAYVQRRGHRASGWHCSRELLGTGEGLVHTLPALRAYEIASERGPGAEGQTTRPKKEEG